MKTVLNQLALGLLGLLLAVPAFAYSDYATNIIAYTQGTNGNSSYADPLTALGPPTRTTGAADVTMFFPAFGTDQIVSIGAGGWLTVGFDHQVMNDALNPFGLDLLIFGNAFFSFQSGTTDTAGGIAAEPGYVQVSQDNSVWFDVTPRADGLFPTQGFSDSSLGGNDGTTLSNDLLPVDPTLGSSFVGLSYAELLAAYNGSAGGTGIDIGEANLDWIQYVRVFQPGFDGFSTEIDAFADVAAVPIPGAVWLMGSGLLGLIAWRRRSPSS